MIDYVDRLDKKIVTTKGRKLFKKVRTVRENEKRKGAFLVRNPNELQ